MRRMLSIAGASALVATLPGRRSRPIRPMPGSLPDQPEPR